jgi:hypothetical protein
MAAGERECEAVVIGVGFDGMAAPLVPRPQRSGVA